MTVLSTEKLNKYKKEKCYTNKRIADETGISLVTIDNIFSGKNKNPTVNYLQKIANVLECSMDDLIDYDENSPLAGYYENNQTARLAQEIHDNPDYRILLDATKDLRPEDLHAVIDIANRIKGSYNG